MHLELENNVREHFEQLAKQFLIEKEKLRSQKKGPRLRTAKQDGRGGDMNKSSNRCLYSSLMHNIALFFRPSTSYPTILQSTRTDQLREKLFTILPRSDRSSDEFLFPSHRYEP